MLISLNIFIAFAASLFSTIRCAANDSDTQTANNAVGKRGIDCARRCEAIYSRSLAKIHYTRLIVETLGSGFRRLGDDVKRDICWKSNDFMDCMNQCESAAKERSYRTMSKTLRIMCRATVADEVPTFACISKFHSFLEIRCSSFMNEALERNNRIEDPKQRKIDTCRYLHYHSLCLSSSIDNYCPDSQRIFNLPNLRHYFLSFLLPQEEAIFSETFLDDCQIIVKSLHLLVDNGSNTEIATHVTMPDKQLEESTTASQLITTTIQPLVNMSATTSRTSVTTRESEIVSASASTPADTVDENHKKEQPTTRHFRLFSPQIDFISDPPNFYYSSVRYSLRSNDQQITSSISPETSHEALVHTVPISVVTRSPDILSSSTETRKPFKDQFFQIGPKTTTASPRFFVFGAVKQRPQLATTTASSLSTPLTTTASISPTSLTTTNSNNLIMDNNMIASSDPDDYEDFGMVTPAVVDFGEQETNPATIGATHRILATTEVEKQTTLTTPTGTNNASHTEIVSRPPSSASPTTRSRSPSPSPVPPRHYTGRIIVKPIRSKTDPSSSENDRFWNPARYRTINSVAGGDRVETSTFNNRQKYHVVGGTTELPVFYTTIDGQNDEYADDVEEAAEKTLTNSTAPDPSPDTVIQIPINKVWPLSDVKTIDQLNKLTKENENAVLMVVYALLGGTVLASTIGLCLAMIRRQQQHRKCIYEVNEAPP